LLKTLSKKYHTYVTLTRLNRPIGILLLLWPTLWALWIAGHGRPTFSLVVIFIIGTVLMRSAGCIINDIADKRFDGDVTRTKNRPLVTGQLSTREALILFFILCLFSAFLLLPLNTLTRELAIPAVVLASCYPFMKRYTHLPQFILGLAFSWGIPMAFAAQTGTVPAIAWLIFLINCLWAVAYDTIYAMVDRQDDLKIGVKSTAILFGQWDTKIIALLHVIILLLLIGLGIHLAFGIFFYLGLILAAMIMIYLQYLIQNRESAKCFQAFLMSQWIGATVFLGIIMSSLL